VAVLPVVVRRQAARLAAASPSQPEVAACWLAALLSAALLSAALLSVALVYRWAPERPAIQTTCLLLWASPLVLLSFQYW
jgi:hypothetical protein